MRAAAATKWVDEPPCAAEQAKETTRKAESIERSRQHAQGLKEKEERRVAQLEEQLDTRRKGSAILYS